MTGPISSFEQDDTTENERLRFALQAAGIGTWDYNIVTGEAQWSGICKQLFGLEADVEVTAAILLEQVHPDDRQRVAWANAQALDPLNYREHNITFRTSNQEDALRWVQAKGRTIRDVQGRPIRFSGMVQDVTQQQQAQVALERQVLQRTEELAASNEEFIAANEELTEINGLLLRSNENLQQFAYIASHDLQEPLRKIQQFGDMLKLQYADQLGEGVDFLERMQVAARRMSTLIRDLLAFSRISTQRDVSAQVSLEKVIREVVDNLELAIQETGGEITVRFLPTLLGDPSQLAHLFHNLLSNALKFQHGGTVPRVEVSSCIVRATELPASVTPTRLSSAYHCISVSDNGIGFEEKHLGRIFQVFQRLHGKSEFAGTGIGLAICEKVVANHGGAITATSQPGRGATFNIFLPV